MNTTNMVTNTDGAVEVHITADHIAVAPLLWLAVVILLAVIGVWWAVSKQQEPKAK